MPSSAMWPKGFFEGGGRVSPRRARYLFFASPKKSTQKKGDPAVCDPRCYGANLRRGVCGVRRGTRYALARCARTTTASQITKHAREGAHATPQTPRRRRSQKGVGRKEQPNSHTGHCCARPSLRSAWRLRPGGVGRAQRRPVWMSGCGFPSGCAEERRFWRIRARVCLSDAKRREFSETPAKLSTAGCPQRSEGTQPVGSLFLGLLSFGEAKESESPAGARPGPRTRQRHTTSYKNNSY
jgi:hypothetical protein